MILHREGGDARTEKKLPGRTTFDGITLERGVTSDLSFSNWAEQIAGDRAGTLSTLRKSVLLDLYDDEGQLVVAYQVYGCWPSSYEAVTALDADGSAVALERMTLQYDRWERDVSVGVGVS